MLRRLLPVIPLAIGAVFAARAGDTAPAVAPAGGSEARPPAFYSRQQALRGKALYAEHCGRCHLEDLAGAGPALPLAGGSFMSRWQNQSVYDLYARVRTTMPQDRPGSLSDQMNIDIVAFLLRANGLPAGAAELAPEESTLNRMTIGVPE